MDKKNKKKINSASSNNPEEPKETVNDEKPVVESKPVDPESIFIPDKVEKIFNAKDPIESTNTLLQDHYRKINGNANFDEDKLKAQAEFHVNNLVFLKQKFSSFDDETISSLMNILAKLINFSKKPEEKNTENNVQQDNQSNLNNSNLKNEEPKNENLNEKNLTENPSQLQENNEEVHHETEQNDDEKKNIEKKLEEDNTEVETVDFLSLSKNKLNEFKESLIAANLFPKTKNDFAFANKKDKTRTDGKFFLNLNEINSILNYIKSDYLPYIRMWYFFEKGKRNITERKLEVIINTPTLLDMPLSMATEEKLPESGKKEETEEEQKKREEEEKKKEEEEEQKKEEELKKAEEEKKMLEEQNKEETYLDLLERLGLNEETKKIIIEKVEELHKEVDGKIDNRKKTLEDKVKEIEESVHGKKK